MEYQTQNSRLQKISFSKNVQLYMLRLDEIHPHISGNKWYKLKYNLLEASRLNKKILLTFGGAYSNHILAVAAAGKENNLHTIGIIRGDEHLPLNPTLQLASDFGMQLYYMDRVAYRNKNTDKIIKSLYQKFGDFYLIPEGGTNSLAIKGAAEIIQSIPIYYDYICSSIGTGGTIAGIIKASNKKVLGFSALKGNFIEEEVMNLADNKNLNHVFFHHQYHFGGYAKANNELITFINQFKKKYNIPLDPIYTGKMMYGIFDLISKNYFEKGKTIIAIHTGGLQGIKGFNLRFNHLIDE